MILCRRVPEALFWKDHPAIPRIFPVKFKIAALTFSVFTLLPLAQGADSSKNVTLIVPGESIGILKLGDRTDASDKALGEPDYGDMAMGKGVSIWYLGAKKGDKGHQFHRPDELGCWIHRDDEGHHYLITQAQVTSPKYHTAGGIAPGSSLVAIMAAYPDVKLSGDQDDAKSWPPYGPVEIQEDTKAGIAFVIRKSDSVCIEVIVKEKGVEGVRNPEPAACWDYSMINFEGSVGDVKLGMTAKELVAILGEPDDKGGAYIGSLWRWRLPSQAADESPAFCVYLTQLPKQAMVASQIRVSSPFFNFSGVSPGCAVTDLWKLSRNGPAWIEEFAPSKGKTTDVYADLTAGSLFEVDRDTGKCIAITIIPQTMDIVQSISNRAQSPVKKSTPAPAH